MEPNRDRRQAWPYDYAAIQFGVTVGRCYRGQVTSHEGAAWRWSMYAHVAGHMGNANGRSNDKTEAAADVERRFKRLAAADER